VKRKMSISFVFTGTPVPVVQLPRLFERCEGRSKGKTKSVYVKALHGKTEKDRECKAIGTSGSEWSVLYFGRFDPFEITSCMHWVGTWVERSLY
jgi:hypothetical protein